MPIKEYLLKNKAVFLAILIELVVSSICIYAIYYGLTHKNIVAIIIGFIALVSF